MAEAGTILGVSVIGQPGGWSVILKMDRTQKPLGAQKADRPRTWRSLDTLTEYLRKDLHIVHIDAVDGTHYSSAGATRPDAAARMKRAHEAAAHDAWFRAEVDAGIKEADDPATEWRSEAHTSEVQSLMRISYAVFCLKNKNHLTKQPTNTLIHTY